MYAVFSCHGAAWGSTHCVDEALEAAEELARADGFAVIRNGYNRTGPTAIVVQQHRGELSHYGDPADLRLLGVGNARTPSVARVSRQTPFAPFTHR